MFSFFPCSVFGRSPPITPFMGGNLITTPSRVSWQDDSASKSLEEAISLKILKPTATSLKMFSVYLIKH